LELLLSVLQALECSPAVQICGALLIAAHPAAFFLVAGYSESLFLMALLGFIYWSTAEGRSAEILGSGARYRDVGNANCWTCMHRFSGGALGI